MAIDRDKVLVAAQKFVEKKKYDKAVAEYQKIIAEDPNDARTLLKIGDLQLKMGAPADAIATYERVGKHYGTQGFALKAIAVYKQIRELIAKQSPALEAQYAHITPQLAELYQQLGLTSDALAALDEVATRLQRQQRDAEAIEVFRKIVELDPNNPLPHLRLAEALSRVQQVDGAVQAFGTAAAQLLKLGRRDDALKVVERLLHHKPDVTQARIAAELYLARGQQADGMQALAKLQLCFQANPRDLDTLNLLSRAFNVIGQAGKAIEVQKEMARIARDTGRQEVLLPLLQQLLRVAPNDEGVRKLATAAGLLGAPPAPAPPPPQPAPQAQAPYRPQGYPQTSPLAYPPPGQAYAPPQQHAQAPPSYVTPPPAYGPTEDEPAQGGDELSYEPVDPNELIQDGTDQGYGGRAQSAPMAAARQAQAGPDEGQLEVVEQEAAAPQGPSEQVQQILADAASFRRVRLYSKAISTLRQGVQLEPRSLDVRETLRDVLLEAGRTQEAVEEMLAIASLYVDVLDGEAAARTLEDVLTIDPTNGRAVEMLGELGYEYVPATPGSEVPPSYGGQPNYGATAEAPLPSYDLEEMGPSDVSNRYDDGGAAVAVNARGTEPDAPLPAFPLEAPEADASQPFDLVQQAEGGYEAGETEVEQQPYPGERASVPPAELEEALEEAEFFVSRGLYEDARSILQDQLQLHPNNRLLREKLGELEQQDQNAKRGSGTRERPLEDVASTTADEGTQVGIDRSFDIAASLDAVEDTAVPSFSNTEKQVDVEEVFAKFKEGVAKQISLDDGQSHYDLGVAYKEMGLVDDAIREFETAARDPKRECVCRSMIGTLQMERGNVNEAIDAFMRGLHAPQKNGDQETVLCFEIGNAYEIKKMNREALSYFQKVMRREPNYRDVQERVRKLSSYASKAPPRAAAVGADDEFDRAFDDLIGKG